MPIQKIALRVAAFAALVVFCSPVGAQDTGGILPVPDYSGDLWSRRNLSGDWDGIRTDLAGKGFQFDVDYTQTLQSIVDGGVEEDTATNGNFDYNATFDLMRMGILPGALVKFRAESRFGDSVNAESGSILPTDTNALFPLTSSLDDGVGFAITNLSYTQFLSKHVAVVLGKFDTLDGDLNEFASGRGTTQFMDANFIFNSVTGLRLPYSALGGGFVVLPVPPGPEGGITVSSTLITTRDSSETSGFDYFDDGLTSSTEANFQYRLKELPGGQNVGFIYSFDQDFTKLGDRLVFQPGQGLALPNQSHTWATYWSAWQYLVVHDPSDAPIDLTNRKADHQGVGLFARAGFADRDTNPVESSFSGGIGGRGVFGRADDSYGLGYYYTRVQTSRFTDFVGLADHAQGAEAYYSITLTPATQLTIDVQLLDSILPDTDTGYLIGGRLRIVL